MIGIIPKNNRRGNGASPKKGIRVFSSKGYPISGMDSDVAVKVVKEIRDLVSNRQVELNIRHYEIALWMCGGFKSFAARMLHVTPAAVTLRIKRSPRLQEVIEEIKDSRLDLGESELMKAVRKGAPWAIQYLLSRIGVERGYYTRQEFTGTGRIDHIHSGGVLLLPQPANNLNDWESLAFQWDQRQLPAPNNGVEDAEFEEE